MTYQFYLFVGKFPKLFSFSDGEEKSYLVELNVFKENAFYGLQKILLDNVFPYCLKSRKLSYKEIKMVGHRISFSDSLQKLKFRGRFCGPCTLPW